MSVSPDLSLTVAAMESRTHSIRSAVNGEVEPDGGEVLGDNWPFDHARLKEILANEADMSFKRRSEAVFDFLRIGPEDRVLDLGSGRGFYLSFMRELYPDANVVGLELDRPLLRTALKRVAGARVVNASAYALPFSDGAFDRILFSEVIEHIPDDERAMQEITRVLAPGGILALTTPNADYPLAWDPVNKTLERTLGTHIQHGPLAGIWANHVRLYSLEGVVRLVTDSGLEVIETRCLTHHSFPFIHNLVYGVGKELLEAGVLPPSLAAAADRFETSSRGGSWRNPIRIGLAAFNLVDGLNDLDPPAPDRSFLITAIQARKPLTVEAR